MRQLFLPDGSPINSRNCFTVWVAFLASSVVKTAISPERLCKTPWWIAAPDIASISDLTATSSISDSANLTGFLFQRNSFCCSVALPDALSKVSVIERSIVWDRRSLAIRADFEPTGPCLPIEFCRVSRDERLTLVIDKSFGAPCITYSALSVFDDLDAAIQSLRDREDMPNPKGIGFTVVDCSRQSARAIERHPQAIKPSSRGLMRMAWTLQFGRPSEATSPKKRASRSRSKPQSDISKRGPAIP